MGDQDAGCWHVVTHTDVSSGGRVFTAVCLCVCFSTRYLKNRWPNLTMKEIKSPGNLFILGQKVKVTSHWEKHCKIAGVGLCTLVSAGCFLQIVRLASTTAISPSTSKVISQTAECQVRGRYLPSLADYNRLNDKPTVQSRPTREQQTTSYISHTVAPRIDNGSTLIDHCWPAYCNTIVNKRLQQVL